MQENNKFMKCFDVEAETVPLDELFPVEDDTDGEDYENDYTVIQRSVAVIQPSELDGLPSLPAALLFESSMLPLRSGTSRFLVLTRGDLMLAPGTIVAPSGSIVVTRTMD